MNEEEMNSVLLSAEKVTEIYYANDPWNVLHTLPAGPRKEIPGEICKMLIGKGLTLRQAEMILDMAKALLRKTQI